MTANAEHTIEHVVDALIDSWNRRDWTAFGRLFADDAQYFTGASVQLSGRDQICQELALLAETPHSSGHVTMTPESVRFFWPDIAVVWCRWRMGSDDRRAGLLTMVMEHVNSRWRIVVLRNAERAD